jgi:hypothetical protein
MNHLALRPPVGVNGCATNRCGVPYGTPYGPFALNWGLADAPAAAAPASDGILSKLPSWWPYAGLALGGAMALTGIVLMATKS